MSVINITEDQMERFVKICSKRPQDTKQRDTFEYLLRLDHEFGIRNERGINPIPAKHAPGSVSQPAIINSEELQNKAYMDSKRSIAERIRKGENKND